MSLPLEVRQTHRLFAIISGLVLVEFALVRGHVFVAAAGEVEDYEFVRGETRRRPRCETGTWGTRTRRKGAERTCLKWALRSFGPLRVPQDDILPACAFDEAGDGVGGFEGGDDAFGAGEELRGGEGLIVGDGGIFGAALIG